MRSVGLRSPETGQRLHRLCFHYLYQHGTEDADKPCEDERCPSRMLEHGTPIENYWFFERRHGPMKRFVEAALTYRDVRRALEAGIDGPEAIIAYCKETANRTAKTARPLEGTHSAGYRVGQPTGRYADALSLCSVRFSGAWAQ